MDYKLFDQFRNLFYEKSGIFLKDHKIYLIENRLQKYVNKYCDGNFEEYYSLLRDNPEKSILTEFVNALTTNYSYFFRDPIHFDFLKFYLNHKFNDDYLRIWSAACSTGQEPYSAGIILDKNLAKIPTDSKILATDISTRVLEEAKKGIYQAEKVENYIDKSDFKYYFEHLPDRKVVVRNNVKRHITFGKLNLLGNYPFKKNFDIIFLRNVLIYFDKEEKEVIINKLYNYVKPGGYLILGLSETLTEIKSNFRNKKYSIYKREK